MRLALDKWILLHVRKKLINLAFSVLNRLLPERAAVYPQTHLLEQVYQNLLQAYSVEAYCGRFDDVPHQVIEHLRDRHFLNILEVSRKVLTYLADTDRYYRQWLGLFFLLVHDGVEKQQQDLLYDEFLDSIKAQWEFDMRGAFGNAHFNENKRRFQEIQLANSLYTLCSKDFEGYSFRSEIRKKGIREVKNDKCQRHLQC
jgi:hypothetical protein